MHVSIPYQDSAQLELEASTSAPDAAGFKKMVQGIVVLLGYICFAGLVVLTSLWHFKVIDVEEVISDLRDTPQVENVERKIRVWRRGW